MVVRAFQGGARCVRAVAQDPTRPLPRTRLRGSPQGCVRSSGSVRPASLKDYTMHEVLDELALMECFKEPGKRLRIGEMTKKQIGL